MTHHNLSTERNESAVHYRRDTSGCHTGCVSDMIRKRAYDIFKARDGLPNHELDDWLQAEREVKHHLGL